MDSDSFLGNIHHMASMGGKLSVQQRSAVNTSLLRLKNDNNGQFTKVIFWGKVNGIANDYLVATGYEKYEIPNPSGKCFYSLDGISWKALEAVDDQKLEDISYITGPFTGDPAHPYKYEAEDKAKLKDLLKQQADALAAGEEVPAEVTEALAEGTPKREVEVKETERLSGLIKKIDEQCSIFPRSAFLLNPSPVDGKYNVSENRAFEGLSVNEALCLDSYLHSYHNGDLVQPSASSMLDKTVDFVNNIIGDDPAGAWCTAFDPSESTVYLRNLKWPGFLFYHTPGTRNYGYTYCGEGEANSDVAFML